jgi:MtN3 and saliva related transmembrane protein
MNMTDTIGLIAGVLTTISFVPQVVKIWRSRSARDISYAMYACFVSGVSLWLCYGIAIGALPLVLNNSVVLLLAITILVLKYRAERENGERIQ